MDTWDEQKLSEVAEKKHGEADLARPNQTDIVSLHKMLLVFTLASVPNCLVLCFAYWLIWTIFKIQ
jgi:hypothetical protein